MSREENNATAEETSSETTESTTQAQVSDLDSYTDKLSKKAALQRLRALRTYYFRMKREASRPDFTKPEQIEKADEHILQINQRISAIACQPLEDQPTEGYLKRGNPRPRRHS